MLTTEAVRVLDDRDLAVALDLLDRDPVCDIFVGSRVRAAGLIRAALGAEVWGYAPSGRIEALCYSGANLVPVQAGPAAARAFAERALGASQACSSIVGPRDAVSVLWRGLREHWSARDIRPVQPLLATSSPPAVPGDPGVRRVRLSDLDTVLPASVAMYTEEVGISPLGPDGGVAYRAKLADLVGSGRAFARIDNGEVLFKAEIAAAVPGACQLQGVWVVPRLRGRGLGTAGMATVVREALRTVAPTVCLYVNDYNQPARAAYARVGFRRVGTYMSVLF